MTIFGEEIQTEQEKILLNLAKFELSIHFLDCWINKLLLRVLISFDNLIADSKFFFFY